MSLIVVKSYHYLLHTSWILDWIDLIRVSPVDVCQKRFVGRVSADVCQKRFVKRVSVDVRWKSFFQQTAGGRPRVF